VAPALSVIGYYSAALDEVYRLRAALAHEAVEREADLALKTFPRSRRRHAREAVARMRAAAHGDSDVAYTQQDGFDAKSALISAGADECLTRHGWEREVDNNPSVKGVVPEGRAAARSYDRTRQRWSLALAAGLAPDDNRLTVLFKQAPLMLWSAAEGSRDASMWAWSDLTEEVQDHYLAAALTQVTGHEHSAGKAEARTARRLLNVYAQANRMLDLVMLKHTTVADVLHAVLVWLLSTQPVLDVEARLRTVALSVSMRKEFAANGYRWTGPPPPGSRPRRRKPKP
jgi:hypothetical protein